MKKKRIFVVDDEPGFTRLLKLTLERTGNYTVLEQNDGTQAWLTAREFKPDIIFLDIVMPKIDVCSALHPFIAAPDAATSSSTIDASVMPCPPPPHSSGMAMPTHPPSAMAS